MRLCVTSLFAAAGLAAAIAACGRPPGKALSPTSAPPQRWTRLYTCSVGSHAYLYMVLKGAGTSLSGWSGYERERGRQHITGTIQPDGTWALIQAADGNRPVGVISVRPSSDGDLRGTWLSPDRKQQYRFEARLETAPFTGSWDWHAESRWFGVTLVQTGATIKGSHNGVKSNGRLVDSPEDRKGKDAISITGTASGDTAMVTFKSYYNKKGGGTARIVWRGSKLEWQILTAGGPSGFAGDVCLANRARDVFTVQSPGGSFEIEDDWVYDDDFEHRVWIKAGVQRKLLPCQPVLTDMPEQYTDIGYRSGTRRFESAYHVSPDDQWIFTTVEDPRLIGGAYGEVYGFLFQRRGAVVFEPATDLEFDLLAWKQFAATQGLRTDKVQSTDCRTIRFVSWSADSRFLTIELGPVKLKGSRATVWEGCFDTHLMKFVDAPR